MKQEKNPKARYAIVTSVVGGIKIGKRRLENFHAKKELEAFLPVIVKDSLSDDTYSIKLSQLQRMEKLITLLLADLNNEDQSS